MTVQARVFIDESKCQHPRLKNQGIDPVKPIIEGYRVGRVHEPWFTEGDERRVTWVDVPEFKPHPHRKREIREWIEQEFPEIAETVEDSISFHFCAYEGAPPIILCQINWWN